MQFLVDQCYIHTGGSYIHTYGFQTDPEAHMWPYQGPPAPYRWGSGGLVVPSMAGEHGPAGCCPSRAAPRTHVAPHAVARTHPETVPESNANGAALWLPCALRPAACALRVRGLCWPTRWGRPAEAGAAVQRPTAAAMTQSATTAAASAALGGGLVAASW